jgi:outer membrane protein assembly factor BamA
LAGAALASAAPARAQAPQAPPPRQSQAQAPAQGPGLHLEFSGGTPDDQAFARAAAGIVRGLPALEGALAAIRATDRFREVSALDPGPGEGRIGIRLVPWPALQGWTLEDDGAAEAPDPRRLFPELRRGIRAGQARRASWRARAQEMLRAAGFPAAEVAIRDVDGGARLAIRIQRGAPARIRRLEFTGTSEPYGEAALWKLAGAVPGRTLWTLAFRREALARLRKRFLKDHRYEWRAELEYREDGALRLAVDPGPVVEIKAEGASLGFGGIEELVPLARAERYGPELLDEGDRRIFRFLRNQGFLDPEVAHRRDVVAGPLERPQRVRITYSVRPGPKVVLAGLRFEGNEALTERELLEAAALPRGLYGWGAPKASPELLQALEDRVRALYLRRGFSEIRVRRAVPVREGGRWVETLSIREGVQRHVSEVRLTLPGEPSYDPWAFGEDLLPILGDRPPRIRGQEPPDGSARVYEGDRPPTLGTRARLTLEAGEQGGRVLVLRPERPLPYVKGDLVQAVAAMRARQSSLGVLRPKEDLEFDESGEALRIRLRISDQPRGAVSRMVVQGSDRTRARAILREAMLEPGTAASPEGLGRAQARIANLGAFQRVDLEPLPGAEEGSLALRLTERNPWVFSHSFGYDRSQGYHVGTGIQRLNVGGMGRSVDFGIRAGDATLNSEALRKAFPTGEFSRSVDAYTLAYSDPRFDPAFLDRWLPDRTQYRAEAGYIVERQSVYEVRRRRVVNTFDWRVGDQKVFQVGHRFERAEVESRIEPKASIAEEFQALLAQAAKVPDGKVIISAPFLQFVRDTRDSPFDPTRGTLFYAHLDFANQVFGTSANSSFVRLDLRHQWNWPVGYNASRGVVALGLRLGVANPTAASAENFPLSERFFAGGPFTHRGIEPDSLGPRGSVPLLDPATGDFKLSADGANRQYELIPLGGQGLALVNLEYRFPVYASWLWAEVFIDSGQVYASLRQREERLAGSPPPYPPFRTSLGLGVILKLGLPIKIEYAADVKRILGRPRTKDERDTELHGVLVSAGFQF